jgi:osmotically-inducible protein OsmY
MANRQYEGYRGRSDLDDERRRDQQGYGYRGDRSPQQGQGGWGEPQQRGEQFSRNFAPGGEQGGWQSDDEYGPRGRSNFEYGPTQGDYRPRQASRYEGSAGWRPDSGYEDWQSRQGGSPRTSYGGHLGESGTRRWSGSRPYGGRERGYREGGRDFWDRASDEVSSWFGDEDAERRREMDRYRGRGPRNYVRSDERIKEDVNDRLTDDGMIDASDVEVEVSGREVTLSGHVDNRMAKRRAEDIAESVSGVTHVQNNLRVRQDSDATSTRPDDTAGLAGTMASTSTRRQGSGI